MNENKTWGASPDDWDHFDIILGLGTDLLPVVSNPNAVVSKRSTIKALGKVPSLYNKEGKAVGILDWTSKETKPFEIDKWSKVRDYGICLQTRAVRALDIDVEDSALAAEIESVIFNTLGFALPKRYRADSAKRLFAFQAPILEKINKRVLKVEGGIIELLGDGQQAVIVGTHPSGQRYEWTGGLPDSFPVIDIEPLWYELVERFGIGEGFESSGQRNAKGSLGIELPAADETSESLEVLGIAKSIGREGQVYIECPWKHEHTDAGATDSATGTAYFPAGGRGYEMGHFVCKHAHCAGRGDSEFRVALGLEEEGGGFDVLPEEAGVEAGSGGVALPLDYTLRTNDDGKALSTVENLSAVLSRADLCGHDIRYDTFRDEIVYRKSETEGDWIAFKDTDYTKLRINLALTGFLPISREMIRDVVHYVAGLHKVDTAQEWLNTLPPWDNVPRVSAFLKNYMGTESTPYTTAVSEYMWAAMAGRILDPGCKADGAPIFIGEQYIGKSFAIAAMVPSDDLFVEVKLDDDEDNLARKMRGKLIAEFAELRGLHTKEMEGIKAFVSRQKEEWVPKYAEFSTNFRRRLIFIGTSNKDEIFADETGERRWFPVTVLKGDCIAIKRDRELLWAEAKVMFQKAGSVQGFYEKANDLARATREDFMITDVWEGTINTWLHTKDDGTTSSSMCDFLQIDTIMREALNMDIKNLKTFDMMRVGKILRKFGYKKNNHRINGVLTKVWIKI